MATTILGAVPHAVTQDDYYEGYLIPKGAGVLYNVYTINMGETRHPDPRSFASTYSTRRVASKMGSARDSPR
jgi:hypothetical protein